MNKLIWKGIDSSTIKGLLICELPPITKPKMRVQETVIDGVDGSIIEELGYESYDKTIKIGLTYDFDIDEIIKYFSGEGEVVFSNEPDKYYKASILNRIDYERLLRFREATVKFRVQPFKYQYNEEKIIAETGSVEGTEIKISDVKAIQLQIDGRSIQNGEPTPETPVEIESVGYENLFDGEFRQGSEGTSENLQNLFSKNDLILSAGTYTFSCDLPLDTYKYAIGTSQTVFPGTATYIDGFHYTESFTFTLTEKTHVGVLINGNDSNITPNNVVNYHFLITKGKRSRNYIPYGKYGIEVETVGKNIWGDLTWETSTYRYFKLPKENTNYTLSIRLKEGATIPSGLFLGFTEKGIYSDVQKIRWIILNGSYGTSQKKDNFYYVNNFTSDTLLNYISVFPANYADILTDYFDIQLEENKVFTEYQSYQKNTAVIVLNESLRSLPNGVEDIAYIKNNKLYVDRYVGSKIINGAEYENYGLAGEGDTTNGFSMYSRNGYGVFPNIKNDFNKWLIADNFKGIARGGLKSSDMNFITSAADYAYVLNIDRKLLETEDIDGFRKWLSEHPTQVDYELATPITEEFGDFTIIQLLDGENNISNSADANMIIDYIETLNVNNMGNHTSKPIFEIEGVGKVDFILNNSNVFSYNFDDDGKVVIDSEKEDAYLGLTLKNRNMNGDFPIFNPGENKFTWDGLIKNISVSKKSRWL